MRLIPLNWPPKTQSKKRTPQQKGKIYIQDIQVYR